MTTGLDLLLGTVDWEELPEPVEEQELPWATHQGWLDVGGIRLRCYVLNTGQRLFDAEQVAEMFGLTR